MFRFIENRWHSTSANVTLRYCAVVQTVIVRFQTHYGYFWKNLPSLRMSCPVLFTYGYAASSLSFRFLLPFDKLMPIHRNDFLVNGYRWNDRISSYW